MGIFVGAALTIPQIPRLVSLARDDSGGETPFRMTAGREGPFRMKAKMGGGLAQEDSKEGAASLRMTAKNGHLARNDKMEGSQSCQQ